MPGSRRLKANADARFALPKPRKFPDPGAGGIDIGGDIDIDQVGFVGGDTLADSFADIAGAIDANALHAAGARHRGEIRIVPLAAGRMVKVGGQLPAAEVAALQAADRGISVIVP